MFTSRRLQQLIPACLLLWICSLNASPAAADVCPLATGKPYRSPNETVVYLVTPECTKRPFFNPAVYLSYFNNWNLVTFVEQPALDAIPHDALNFLPWGPLRPFKNGSLVKLTSSPVVYLLEDRKAFPLADEQTFKAFGYSFDQVEDVAAATLKPFIIQSTPLRTASDAPISLVFKYPDQPDVYVLQSTDAGLVKTHLKTMDEVNSISRGDRIATLDPNIVYKDRSDTQVSSPLPDVTRPIILTFQLEAATTTSRTIGIKKFTVYDDVGTTGYMITESTSTPSAQHPDWKPNVPASYTFASTGTKMLFAWTKDAVGHISSSTNATVTILNADADTIPPNILTYSVTANPSGFTVSWRTNEPADSVVSYGTSTAYGSASSSKIITNEHTIVVADAVPGSTYHFSFSSADPSGNRQSSNDQTISIRPDDRAPTVAIFNIPSSSTSMTIPVNSLVATDDVGVTGYMITRSGSPPSILSSDWTANPPQQISVSGGGTITFYAWARDASGNISLGRAASTIISPGLSYPTISSIATTISDASLTITWTTSQQATSVVYYGTTVDYASTVTDTSFISAHSATINGLQPGTLYHYMITATNKDGTLQNSGDKTVSIP